jgi:hypothetical protein
VALSQNPHFFNDGCWTCQVSFAKIESAETIAKDVKFNGNGFAFARPFGKTVQFRFFAGNQCLNFGNFFAEVFRAVLRFV